MSKSRIKLGIYGISLLMMGVIGVSGALSVIGANFPDASQTMIQNIISIPCLVVIPVTLLVGKLMEMFSKKMLALVGVVLFLIGGVGPMFLNSLTGILVLRAVFGVAIGIIQPVSSALVAENFEGPERDQVQGNSTSAQMLGCAIMVFAGGWLATISWELTFAVHLIGVLALILVLTCLPDNKPEKKVAAETASDAKLTPASWCWALTMFLLFIGGQVHAVYMAFIVSEKSLGTAAQSGNTMAFFAIGGFLLGLVYGALAERTKKLTLAVGLLGIVVSYLLIAFATSMVMIYAGAFLFGVSLSICMPNVIVGTANSVPLAASGMAISITMCGQNLAQFLCPYIINPLTAAFGNGTNENQLAFLMGAALTAVMVIVAVIWGLNNKSSET